MDWLYVGHHHARPFDGKLRVSGPAPGEGITLTLLGEPTALLGESSTLARSRLGARQRRTFSIYDPSRERGLDPTPQMPPRGLGMTGLRGVGWDQGRRDGSVVRVTPTLDPSTWHERKWPPAWGWMGLEPAPTEGRDERL